MLNQDSMTPLYIQLMELIEKDIQSKVNEQMDKNQRDYYLREQMRAISNELDDFDDTREEAEEYKSMNPGERSKASGKESPGS